MRCLLALSLFLVVESPLQAHSSERPNVILAMADDQGWGDMAYNGHRVLKTPAFDEMARTGLRFDRFYAAAPVCSPTRGSVMTGRTPNRFGCFKWGYTLRPEEVTVAEALREAGYATGHFGKWHLGSMRADSPVSPGQSGFERWFSSPNFFEINPWMSQGGKAIQTNGEGSEVIVDAALEFIRNAARGSRPFLAVVWFGSPHAPHVGTEADLAMYADQPKRQRAFLAEITAMDRAMGKLRKGLRDAGVAEKTLLWYCSDNGAIAEGSTGGLRGKKGQIWEGGLRVPGLLEWPARIGRPRVTGVPCCTVDIYPTLLELAGARAPRQPPLDGVSLVPLFEGKMESRPRPLGFWDYTIAGIPVKSTELLKELAEEQASGKVRPASEAEPIPAAQLRRDYSDQAFPGHSAWLHGDWKLHRIEAKRGPVKWELYNLAADRTESSDLLSAEPDRASRMKTALDAWLRSVVASLNGKDYATTQRDLILVAGQSNAVGYDAYPENLPADPLGKDVLLWWRCGDPPPDEHDSTSRGKWLPLQVQPRGNPMSRDSGEKGERAFGLGRQYGNFAKSQGGFGPEIGFARELCADNCGPLAIVKAAFSGSGMRTDWNAADAGDGGACYRALVEETKAAIASAAAQGIQLRLRAIVWIQGESDANPKDAPNYQKSLGDMLTALRKDLDAPQLIALLGVNTRFGNGKNPFVSKVIEAQQAIAAKDKRCVYVDTAGAETLPPTHTHFTAAGTLEVGRRFARALLRHEAAGTTK